MKPLKMRADVFVLDVLNAKRRKTEIPIQLFYKKSPYQIKGNIPTAGGMVPLEGNRWRGEAHEHIWLRAEVCVPSLGRYERAEFFLDTGDRNLLYHPQMLVYIDGKIICALDTQHKNVLLDRAGKIEIFVCAYSNCERDFDMELCANLVITDTNTEELYYDLLAPLQVMDYSKEDTREYAETLRLVNESISLVDLREPYSESYEKSVEAAKRYIRENLYGKVSGDYGTVVGIGHTHIDIAWLWRYKQTREKAVRSFATVLYLMDRYSEYKFMSSQAILYKIVKEEAPELYEKIRQRVREGRWEVEGGMWLEADCNLTSGESLVRQILFGKRFFKEEFGVDSKILWLPDVFGYSASLPQILKKSGIDTFVTSKISWNDTNQIPFDTFSWKGIDGTEIFSYFLTAQEKVPGKEPARFTTYNANAEMQTLAGTWERYQQKDLNDEALLTFGWGDGGGGPTSDMLEKLMRSNRGLPGCPKTKIDTATSFIEHLKKNAGKGRLPQLNGELYLEFHRGTYTSVAKVKRNNRKAEFKLQNTEWLSSLAESCCGLRYPKKTLDECWETVLTNQFHDVLPGSAIPEVYADTDVDYARINGALDEICEQALGAISARVKTDKKYLVFNPNSFAADAVVQRPDGGFVLVQNIPPKGFFASDLSAAPTSVYADLNALENEYYRIELDENGDITRLYDKESEREVLVAGGKGNVLEVHEDLPPSYLDNWDIKAYHGEKIWRMQLTGKEIVRQGNRNGIKLYKKFDKSTLVQTIFMYDGVKRIDFETEADWQNDHVCLKVDFPVDLNVKSATYNIQFGNVERPTTRNNSWEEAKFEVCGQKFADISESDYGVCLMNDCKYGYEILGADMRLTLLRTPTYPNTKGEKGRHVFTYALYPHKNSLGNSDAVQQAYLLNNPPFVREIPEKAEKKGLPERFSYVQVSDDRVIAETVKKSEDGRGYVFRLYESTNARVKARLKFASNVGKLWLCDLMENRTLALPSENGEAELIFAPYEVKTLIVEE